MRDRRHKRRRQEDQRRADQMLEWDTPMYRLAVTQHLLRNLQVRRRLDQMLLCGEDNAAGIDQEVGGYKHTLMPVDAALHAAARRLARRIRGVGVRPLNDQRPIAHAIHGH